jgi:H+-translocating NAD(P) transhydrogenase subunit alpha
LLRAIIPGKRTRRARVGAVQRFPKAISRQNFEDLAMAAAVDPIVFYLIIFVLAIFVGYHVVWSVTPALHTPLMSVTNAISAIILVGAMLAAGPAAFDWGGWVGVAAVVMASINAFGGFLVTQRMLEMFKRKEPKAKALEKK